MKKSLLLLAIPLVLFMSGCQMAEEEASEEDILAYVEAQAELVKASSDVDKEMTEQLETSVASEETFVSTVLINDIRHAQIVQEGVLASIQSERVKKPLTELQRIYSGLIESRIYSYEGYVQVLEKDDLALFTSSVSKHKMKDPQVLNKSLIEVNHILAQAELEIRENLLPEKKESK